MTFVRSLKDAIQGKLLLRRAVYEPYLAARYALPTAFRREWTARIADVLACPDLADIPRVPGAGGVRGGLQSMHNGLRVIAGGYYGYPMTRLMRLSGGVHEPQEEKAFGLVLNHVPRGGVMIELGAYWAFYSLWFNASVPDARNYVVEPLANNLAVGRANFAINGRTATFLQESAGLPPSTTLDGLLAREKIDFVHLLHADVQGYEHDVLAGGARAFAEDRIGYAFISTHSADLHRRCIDHLVANRMKILADATPAQSYSFDGLIVARGPSIAAPDELPISRKSPPVIPKGAEAT
jgi:hypothetical protein